MMQLSLATLSLCRNLLAQVALDPQSKDLVQQSQTVADARDELDAAIAEASEPTA